LDPDLKGDEDLDTGEEELLVVLLRDFVPVVSMGIMFSLFASFTQRNSIKLPYTVGAVETET